MELGLKRDHARYLGFKGSKHHAKSLSLRPKGWENKEDRIQIDRIQNTVDRMKSNKQLATSNKEELWALI
jgi:hypothetical protein